MHTNCGSIGAYSTADVVRGRSYTSSMTSELLQITHEVYGFALMTGGGPMAPALLPLAAGASMRFDPGGVALPAAAAAIVGAVAFSFIIPVPIVGGIIGAVAQAGFAGDQEAALVPAVWRAIEKFFAQFGRLLALSFGLKLRQKARSGPHQIELQRTDQLITDQSAGRVRWAGHRQGTAALSPACPDCLD